MREGQQENQTGTMADRNYQSDDNSDEEEQAALDRFLETGVYRTGLDISLSEQNHLQKVQHLRKRHFQNDADANAALRASFRRKKKHPERLRKVVGTAGVPGSVHLVGENSRDAKDTRNELFKERERSLRRKVKASSIFSKANSKGKLAGRNGSGTNAALGSISVAATADIPERVTSSSADTGEIRDAVKKKKKKILLGVGGLGKLSKSTIVDVASTTSRTAETSTEDGVPSSTVPRKAAWSAMEALAEYGSDND